jgi:protein-S-isoprenylcysteine O-methyltransferase Ste14
MIAIGNFFFKYRNLLFPIFALSIFIPSPELFTSDVFGPHYYSIPMIIGLLVAGGGQVIRAATIGLKYIVRGGKDKKVYADGLVVEGMFRHCRNPLYVGNVMMLAGVGIMSNSLYFILIGIPFFIFLYQAIIRAEENYLSHKFGGEYTAYCSTVNRWIPNLKGISQTFDSMQFNWSRYVIKEYNTVYLLLLSIYIILITHHPKIVAWQDNDKITISAIFFVTLSLIYLFVRYLKKSHKLVAG